MLSSVKQLFAIIKCIIFLAPNLYAQVPGNFFHRFTERDGLSNNRVNCFLQDRQGFMWIGTQLGLNKYDGVRFTNYFHNVQDSTSLSDNIINALTQDDKGRLWIATQAGGLNMLPEGGGKFTALRKGGKPALQDDAILSLYFDGKYYLWIGYLNKGWSRLHLETMQIEHGKPPFTFINYWGENASHIVTGFAAAPGEHVWMSTNHGLFLYNPASKSYQTYIDSTGRFTRTHENLFGGVWAYHPDTLLLSTWGCGVKKMAVSSGHFFSYVFDRQYASEVTTNIVKNVAAHPSGKWWVASADKGIGNFSPADNRFYFFEHAATDPHSPPPRECRQVFVDRQGTVWAGFETGLATWSPMLQTFVHVKPEVAAGPRKDNFWLNPLYFDAGEHTLICARQSSNMLWHYHVKTGVQKTITLPASLQQHYGVAYIHKVYDKDKHNLLFETAKGWFNFEKATQKFTPIPIGWKGKKITPANWVTAWDTQQQGLITDAEGRWYQVQLPALTITRAYPENTKWPLPTMGNLLCYEGDSIVWVQERSTGLSRVRINNLTVDSQYLAPGLPPIDEVIDMVQDKKGQYWLTVYSRGIYQMQKNQANRYAYKIWNEQHGLPSNFVGDITIDRQERLWIMTHKGIATSPIDTIRFQKFDDNAGYKEDWYENTNPMLHADGYLFTGHKNGLSYLSLKELQPNPWLPQIYITACRVPGLAAKILPMQKKGEVLRLPWEKNSLTFDFASTNYINPSENQYAYRLIGLRSEWIYIGNTTTLNFAALRPGKYLLEVKGSNNEGVWSNELASFAFNIKPPFYFSWWFISGAILLIAALAFAWYRYRIRMVQNEEMLKTTFARQMAEVEMKALRAQMNPHFIFNSLNSINRYIVKSDQATASGYLTRFAKLIRLILDSSTAETTTLENEIQLLKLYIEMEQLRFEDAFTVDFQVDDAIAHNVSFLIPSMLIQPFVENAIWHGLLHKKSRGELLVHFSLKAENRIQVIVQDNGIGREAAKALKSKELLKEKSHGMKITGDRMDMVKVLYGMEATAQVEDLTDEKAIATGTRVTILLPYTQLQNQ